MTPGGTGSDDARRASEIQSTLFRQYAGIGAPALGAGLQYTRRALAQGGLPGYVQNAYQQAGVGATEQNAQDLSGLRGTIAARAGAQGGGQYLSGLTGAVGSAGDALTRELAGIQSSRAVAGVEQRNKLLGLLAGGAATGTNLAAGFGSLGNQAISLGRQPDQTFGAVTGGLSALTSLYAALSRPQNTNPWAPTFQNAGAFGNAGFGLGYGVNRPLL